MALDVYFFVHTISSRSARKSSCDELMERETGTTDTCQKAGFTPQPSSPRIKGQLTQLAALNCPEKDSNRDKNTLLNSWPRRRRRRPRSKFLRFKQRWAKLLVVGVSGAKVKKLRVSPQCAISQFSMRNLAFASFVFTSTASLSKLGDPINLL